MALTFVWPVMVAVLTVASVQFAVGDGDCGGTFKVSQRLTYFKSPNYKKGPYPNDADCEWTFEPEKAGDGMKIAIMKTFIEGPKYSCENDYIKVTTEDGAGVQRICGDNTKAHSILTRGSKMTARFVSDSSESAKGFYAYAKSMPITEQFIESERFEDNGEIEGPNSNNENAFWQIHAPWGHGINITFTEMTFPDSPEGECDNDTESILVQRKKQEDKNEGHFCRSSNEPIVISIKEPYATISMLDDDGKRPQDFTSSFNFKATYEFFQL